ncbi:MAG: tRNA (guanosine(46)-N7)-methyltransferase TrmB [Spirochaetes bacterium]|nr:tRNA (guanosine(46)-N7)-methyltransferase TrmB [Spirochaetota bacterium]
MQENFEKPLKTIKSFVLRAGRMTKAQADALNRLSPEYVIPFEDAEGAPESQFIKKISELCSGIKKAAGKVIVEIGFGSGKTTAMIAEKNANNFYIGIEVYKPGVGSLLKLIEEKKINNIRIINHDAAEVMEKLDIISVFPTERASASEGSPLVIDGFHIFFPDPWPKRNHSKRRIINADFTRKIINKLGPGGYIYAVTDWKDYGLQMQQIFRSFPALYSPFESFVPKLQEFRDPLCDAAVLQIPWRGETDFERKGLKKNHEIYESFFVRL